MEIDTHIYDHITVVEIKGEIDSKTSPIVQTQLKSLCEPGCKLILNMSQVTYLSSAGLRVLLMLYRQTIGINGAMVLVGIIPEIIDTLAETGFLNYFTLCNTIEAGVNLLTKNAEQL